MLFLALGLILAGVLFFILSSLGESREKIVLPKTKRHIPTDKKGNLDSRLFNVRYPEYKTDPNFDRKFREDRKIKTQKPSPFFSVEENTMTLDFISEGLIDNSNLDNKVMDEDLNQTSQCGLEIDRMEDYSIKNKNDNDFEMVGILYLDKKSAIPFQSKNLKEKVVSGNSLSGLKRIGSGNFLDSEGRFNFQISNVHYEYERKALDQVVFFNEGFALIPSDPQKPVPLFLCDSPDQFKSHLQQKEY